MREVLVVRREDDFSHTLKVNGYSVINCPVIRTEPLDDLSELEDVVSRLDTFDGVFITSAVAAEIFASDQLGSYTGRVYVLGRRSFDILKQTAADVVFNQTANTASEMLAAIRDEELRGKRFLFVRGERSMRTVPMHLQGIANVEEAVVYRTVNIEIEDGQKKDIREKAVRGEIALTSFFSPRGVEGFVEQFGIDLLLRTGLAAIGETTATALQELDLKADVVASAANGERFVADVLKYLKPAAKGV